MLYENKRSAGRKICYDCFKSERSDSMGEIEQLQKIITDSDNIVFFGGAGAVNRERDTGFPQCGRAVSSEI